MFPAGRFLTEIRVPFTSFSYFIPVPIVTNSAAILVTRRITGSAPCRGLQSNGTTFYLSENPFLFPPKFPNFLSEWKAPSMSTNISKLCSSAFFHLHNISRILKFLSPEETKT